MLRTSKHWRDRDQQGEEYMSIMDKITSYNDLSVIASMTEVDKALMAYSIVSDSEFDDIGGFKTIGGSVADRIGKFKNYANAGQVMVDAGVADKDDATALGLGVSKLNVLFPYWRDKDLTTADVTDVCKAKSCNEIEQANRGDDAGLVDFGTGKLIAKKGKASGKPTVKGSNKTVWQLMAKQVAKFIATYDEVARQIMTDMGGTENNEIMERERKALLHDLPDEAREYWAELVKANGLDPDDETLSFLNSNRFEEEDAEVDGDEAKKEKKEKKEEKKQVTVSVDLEFYRNLM